MCGLVHSARGARESHDTRGLKYGVLLSFAACGRHAWDPILQNCHHFKVEVSQKASCVHCHICQGHYCWQLFKFSLNLTPAHRLPTTRAWRDSPQGSHVEHEAQDTCNWRLTSIPSHAALSSCLAPGTRSDLSQRFTLHVSQKVTFVLQCMDIPCISQVFRTRCDKRMTILTVIHISLQYPVRRYVHNDGFVTLSFLLYAMAPFTLFFNFHIEYSVTIKKSVCLSPSYKRPDHPSFGSEF